MLEGSYVGLGCCQILLLHIEYCLITGTLGCCQDAGLETRMQHPSRASASRMLELGAENNPKTRLSCPQGPLNFSEMTSGRMI